jgi:hypothetical protein
MADKRADFPSRGDARVDLRAEPDDDASSASEGTSGGAPESAAPERPKAIRRARPGSLGQTEPGRGAAPPPSGMVVGARPAVVPVRVARPLEEAPVRLPFATPVRVPETKVVAAQVRIPEAKSAAAPVVHAAPAKSAAGGGELDRTKELLAEALAKNEELAATLAGAQGAEDAAFVRMREDHLAEIAQLVAAHESVLAKLKAEQAAASDFMKTDLARAHAVQNQQAPAAAGRRRSSLGLGLLIPGMILSGAAGAAGHARFHREEGPKAEETASSSKSARARAAAKESLDGGPATPESLAAAAMSPEAIASAKLAMSMTEQEGLGVKAAAADLKVRTNMTGISHMLEIDSINHELPTSDRFAEYIRKNTLSSDGDPSIDAWGTPYRLDAPPKPAAVRSAGADQSFDTDDDIVVAVDAIVGR